MKKQEVTPLKNIAVINDISGFGKCSLTVSLPILSALGLECNPIPTAILSNQTGYDDFYAVDFTEHLTPYINVWKRQNVKFDAILTGYLASEKQVDIILDFIDHFGKDSLVFVDPVMADDGVLYDTYDNTLCEKVKALTKRANIITPNLTELCILCDANFKEISKDNDIQKISNLALSLLNETTKTVVVTGIKNNNEVINLIVQQNSTSTIKTPYLNGSYSGTGDIFSSAFVGGIVKGYTPLKALQIAADFTAKCIEITVNDKNSVKYGVEFEYALPELIKTLENN